MNESGKETKHAMCENSSDNSGLAWKIVIQNLKVSGSKCSDPLQNSLIQSAAAEASASCLQKPPEICKYDARPRWMAVSMAHPVEFDLFQQDDRTKFYFADNGRDDTAPSVMSSEGYQWWIQSEPMFMREARLRQIFGAFVCGDALPHMDPWNVDAYTSVETDPSRDMTTAITSCLIEVASDIIAVPAELREPHYLRQEREQEEVQSQTKKRHSD
jgi:hypothetical protein